MIDNIDNVERLDANSKLCSNCNNRCCLDAYPCELLDNFRRECIRHNRDQWMPKPEEPTELKPCPFCGGEAVLCKGYEPDEQWSHKVALVKCQSCGCNTGSYIIDGYYDAKTTVQSAIKAWNKRI